MKLDDLLKNEFLEKLLVNASIDALTLYKAGQEALKVNNKDGAFKCEMLNKIINNCIIPSTCQIGKETRLVYGGQSIILHKNAVIGDYCTISPQITFSTEAILSDFIYMGPGVRVIGAGILVGAFCVIEANAVVTDDIEPCSIVGGNPAKILRKVTPKNFDEMARKYFFPNHYKKEPFLKAARERFMNLQD